MMEFGFLGMNDTIDDAYIKDEARILRDCFLNSKGVLQHRPLIRKIPIDIDGELIGFVPFDKYLIALTTSGVYWGEGDNLAEIEWEQILGIELYSAPFTYCYFDNNVYIAGINEKVICVGLNRQAMTFEVVHPDFGELYPTIVVAALERLFFAGFSDHLNLVVWTEPYSHKIDAYNWIAVGEDTAIIDILYHSGKIYVVKKDKIYHLRIEKGLAVSCIAVTDIGAVAKPNQFQDRVIFLTPEKQLIGLTKELKNISQKRIEKFLSEIELPSVPEYVFVRPDPKQTRTVRFNDGKTAEIVDYDYSTGYTYEQSHNTPPMHDHFTIQVLKEEDTKFSDPESGFLIHKSSTLAIPNSRITSMGFFLRPQRDTVLKLFILTEGKLIASIPASVSATNNFNWVDFLFYELPIGDEFTQNLPPLLSYQEQFRIDKLFFVTTDDEPVNVSIATFSISPPDDVFSLLMQQIVEDPESGDYYRRLISYYPFLRINFNSPGSIRSYLKPYCENTYVFDPAVRSVIIEAKSYRLEQNSKNYDITIRLFKYFENGVHRKRIPMNTQNRKIIYTAGNYTKIEARVLLESTGNVFSPVLYRIYGAQIPSSNIIYFAQDKDYIFMLCRRKGMWNILVFSQGVFSYWVLWGINKKILDFCRYRDYYIMTMEGNEILYFSVDKGNWCYDADTLDFYPFVLSKSYYGFTWTKGHKAMFHINLPPPYDQGQFKFFITSALPVDYSLQEVQNGQSTKVFPVRFDHYDDDEFLFHHYIHSPFRDVIVFPKDDLILKNTQIGFFGRNVMFELKPRVGVVPTSSQEGILTEKTKGGEDVVGY